MANTPSAKKRAKQAEKRRSHNGSLRSMVRTYIKNVVKAIEAKDLGALERFTVNDLEPVMAGRYAEINLLKSLMRENGAQWIWMFGSGPTVLGLFENEAAAKEAYGVIKNHVAVAVFVSTFGSIPKA